MDTPCNHVTPLAPVPSLPKDDAEAARWLAERQVFSVVGAMKGGTCALRSHLRASAWENGLLLPSWEVHFFDEDDEHAKGALHYVSLLTGEEEEAEDREGNWGWHSNARSGTWRGWNDGGWWWDRASDESSSPWQQRPMSWDSTDSNRHWWRSPKAIGDITPSYLYIPAAVPRLQRIIPHSRLVVMLRNPVDRALSHHNHDLAKRRDVGRLRDRWERELAADGPPSRTDVFGRGLYYEQLQRILKHFPRDQVLVVISERYRKDTMRELSRVCAFLGLNARSCCERAKWQPEQHVRGEYREILVESDRNALRNLYIQDVNQLKDLLCDPIPEWTDFAAW